ncbi:hypothetical protein BsWGS_16805 [Bradybaena similaris]
MTSGGSEQVQLTAGTFVQPIVCLAVATSQNIPSLQAAPTSIVTQATAIVQGGMRSNQQHILLPTTQKVQSAMNLTPGGKGDTLQKVHYIPAYVSPVQPGQQLVVQSPHSISSPNLSVSPATSTMASQVHFTSGTMTGAHLHAVSAASGVPTTQLQIAPKPVHSMMSVQTAPQTANTKMYPGTSMKANTMSVPVEGKAAEIGFISSPNFHAKSNRVKATTAHVPVATECMKTPLSQSPRGHVINSPMASPASTPAPTPSPSPGMMHQVQNLSSPSQSGQFCPPAAQNPGQVRITSSELQQLQQQQQQQQQEQQQHHIADDNKGSPAKGKKPKKVRMLSPDLNASRNSPSLSSSPYMDYPPQQQQQYVGNSPGAVTASQSQQHQQQQGQVSGSGSMSSEQDIISPTAQTKQKHKPPPLNVPAHVLQPPSVTTSPTVASSPRKGIIKKSKDDGMDRVLEQVEFEKHFLSLPKFNPEETVSTTPVAQSPRGIINVYKQKNKTSNLAKEGQDGDSNKLSSESEAATPTPKTPKSGRLDDRRFFGDNFNLDLASTSVQSAKVFDFEDINSPRTPKTPSSPGAFSNRRILDQRRQLVMQLFEEHGLYPTSQATMQFQNKYSEIFPSKTCLQLKIREVRQKMMAVVQSTPKTPTTPSAASSSSSSSSSEVQDAGRPSQSTGASPSNAALSAQATGQMGTSLSVPMASQGGQSMLGVGRRSSPLAKSPLAFNSVQ